jgi:hypothetical protein
MYTSTTLVRDLLRAAGSLLEVNRLLTYQTRSAVNSITISKWKLSHDDYDCL